MTRSIGEALTPDLIKRFSPEHLSEHAHNVVLIVTEGEDSFPHPAMLSHFEIAVVDKRNLRIATYKDSRTTDNMRRTGRLSMIVVDTGIAYYIKGFVEELRRPLTNAPHNTLLNFRIARVLADHADKNREGATAITGGITYRDANLRKKIAIAAAVFEEMLG